MPAYIHGNLALDPKRTKVTRVKEVTKMVYKKKIMSTQEKLLYLFTVVICVFVAGVIIFRYAQIYEMNVHLQKLDKEIKTVQAENNKLKLKLEALHNPKEIERKAEEQGMVKDITQQKEVYVPESSNDSVKTALTE
jgi:cell division protein FtsL